MVIVKFLSMMFLKIKNLFPKIKLKIFCYNCHMENTVKVQNIEVYIKT